MAATMRNIIPGAVRRSSALVRTGQVQSRSQSQSQSQSQSNLGRLGSAQVRYRATAVDPTRFDRPSSVVEEASSEEALHLDAGAGSGPAGLRGLESRQGIWKRDEIQKIYDGPLMELIFRAATVHRAYHDPSKMQLCTLMNIKTGGCAEDCKYCSQSSKYKTDVSAQKLVDIEPVLVEARKAKANGSTRFCMGAAWRDLHGRKTQFKRILEMVKEVRGMGMEVCTTLGMLTPEQAKQLKEAGLTAYNNNLDTSREYYGKVVTTRNYDDRLSTIQAVRDAGISVCSGGILGLGEAHEDRVGLIWEMSQMPEPPESFPVNALVAIKGTPMQDNEKVSIHDMLRTIATARIVLPTSIIRFAAGRISFTEIEQAMCFMAGANAIFTGERMLTTPTSGWDEDTEMLSRWGMRGMGAFEGSGMEHHAQLNGSSTASTSTSSGEGTATPSPSLETTAEKTVARQPPLA